MLLNSSIKMQEKSREIAGLWRDYYISKLPDYAFKYEDGDKYMSTHHAIQIDKQEQDIYIRCLENNAEYPLPPHIDKSNGYSHYRY